MFDVFVVIFEWKDRRGGCNSRCGRPVGYQKRQGHGPGVGGRSKGRRNLLGQSPSPPAVCLQEYLKRVLRRRSLDEPAPCSTAM